MQKDIDFKAIKGQVAVLRQHPETGDWIIQRFLKRTERWKFHIFNAWELVNPQKRVIREKI